MGGKWGKKWWPVVHFSRFLLLGQMVPLPLNTYDVLSFHENNTHERHLCHRYTTSTSTVSFVKYLTVEIHILNVKTTSCKGKPNTDNNFLFVNLHQKFHHHPVFKIQTNITKA